MRHVSFDPNRQEEESSSSSSEDDDGDSQQNEELYGKVVCVEGVATEDKKKTLWFPGLVSKFRSISPVQESFGATKIEFTNLVMGVQLIQAFSFDFVKKTIVQIFNYVEPLIN